MVDARFTTPAVGLTVKFTAFVVGVGVGVGVGAGAVALTANGFSGEAASYAAVDVDSRATTARPRWCRVHDL